MNLKPRHGEGPVQAVALGCLGDAGRHVGVPPGIREVAGGPAQSSQVTKKNTVIVVTRKTKEAGLRRGEAPGPPEGPQVVGLPRDEGCSVNSKDR